MTEKRWQTRDYLGLTIIPIELFLGTFLMRLPIFENNATLSILVSVGMFILGFIAMIALFHDFLGQQWREFRREHFWLKIIATLVLVGGAIFLLSFSRSILPQEWLQYGSDSNDSSVSAGVWLTLYASLQPFLAPFAEELTFRYLLFGKIRPKWLQLIFFFVSSILFGLIHINNFGGNWLATIPYMVIGAYFALIYFFSKNIWGSLLVHWLFNTINSLLPAIFLAILSLLGAY